MGREGDHAVSVPDINISKVSKLLLFIHHVV